MTTVWTWPAMGTLATVRLAIRPTDATAWQPAIDRVHRVITAVERACTRFDPSGDIARLVRTPGCDVPVSPLLAAALSLALGLAQATDGLFDPTVGAALSGPGSTGNGVPVGESGWRPRSTSELTGGTCTSTRAGGPFEWTGRCCSILARSPKASPLIWPSPN
ncbi:MAG TPA: FAD:protein FMN transferase [Pseudonocardiaceae bacterium]